MSSTLLETNVQAGVGFTLPDAMDEHLQDLATIFTIPSGVPARVESVYLQVDTPDQFQNWVFELLLVDRSGVILFRQPTPIIGPEPTITRAQLTWSRGANDSGQLPPFIPVIGADDAGIAIYNLPLPESVLQALSLVELQVDRFSDGGLSALTVSQVSVTYTPGGVGTSVTAAPQGIPLLTPTDS